MNAYLKFLSFVTIFVLQFGWILPNLISSADWLLFTFGWIILLVFDPLLIFLYLKHLKLINH
jgi:hypothetical protein